MSSQHPQEGASGSATSSKQTTGAFASAADTVRDAAGAAEKMAAETASTVTSQFKEMVEGRIASGAKIVETFSGSTRRVASDLERDVPEFASLIRTFADRLDGYASDLKNQDLDETLKTATDFTRRQPALVFGLAAMAGFVAFRVIKSAASSGGMVASPSIQPPQPVSPARYEWEVSRGA
ncbi:MAG: hypothetical protein QOD74_815 [Variibacter sp.]|nr:hypothetical protein [Variibacter sp.]